MVNVAVYGTLKEGEKNHPIHLTNLIQTEKGFFNIPYKMFTNGYYPMLVESEENTDIYLEVFKVDDNKMKQLDDLEIPYNYHRRTIKLKGKETELFIYNDKTAPKPFAFVATGNFIATGDINQMPK